MKLNLLIILIVLVFTDTQAKKQRKWRPPLEFGPRTTSIYSSLQRSNRRKINVDLLDHYDDRTKPPRVKLSGSSYKPGTWNWYPNLDIPNYSYRFKIFNLTKDQAGSYIGMHDYRKNYGPLYNTRFGGTYPPIPPLLGDPRQPRLAWYLKQYTPPTPPTSYIDHVMDTVKDGQLREKLHEKQLEPETNKRVSAEWYTVRPKNESNYFHEEDKIKPRFGDYGGIALEDAFPAYKPKEQYEVVMVPERQPIYKRSAEAEISISVQKKSKESKSEEEEAISISFQEKSKESMSEEKEKPKKRLRSEPYSSHSYTYEQFNSNESISGPFTAENQLSSSESKSSSSIELESTKTKHSREKRSTKKKDKSDKKSSDYTEISSELHVSKSASFPAALNTGESGWGAKPPASKSTESGSDSSKASKKSKNKKKSDAPRSGSPTKKKKKSSDYSEISSELHKSKSASTLHTGESGWAKPLAGKSTESSSDSSSKASQKSKKSSNKQKSNAPQSGYPDHSYPRMKPEDDSDKERVSSGLENESFPSASSSAHSSDMVIWDAMRNYSREFKSISSTSDMVSSGDLSKYGSDSGSNSKEKEDPKKGKKNQKNNKKSNIKSKKSSVKGNTKKEKHINLPAKETLKQKLADDKDESGSNYDSDGASAWADVSYVSEITVDPPHLRTFPPTFTEQYVMPLHHQPDDFWDEIYRPDGPEPTLYPWQEEEEKRKKATTTWKPPIITTRDPTSKPKFIYITNEESTDEEDRILESSQQKNKGVSKQHGLGSQLTKTQLQLRQILKFKNKAKGLQKRKVQGIAKNAMNVKGKDKRKKDKKKPKKKDKDKKYNPNNFSRPNPDVLKVQGKHDTQPMMDNPLHNGPKKGNVVGDPLNNIQKGEHKIEEPYLTDPRKIYAAVTPFEPDYSFSEPRPEGNYEWPSLKHPLFNPETAYDEEGFPIHESPDWTSPTTHRKDRIFGKERNQISSGVRGQRISMSQGMKRSQVTEDPNMARLKFVRDHNRQMHVTEDPNMARLKFVRGRKNKMLVKAGLHPEPVNNQVNAGPIIAGLHPDLTHNQVNAGPLPDLSHNQMIAGPLPDLTHNQDVKTLLHPSLIKDKKIAIAKNSKILHNKVVDDILKPIDLNLAANKFQAHSDDPLNLLLHGNQNLFKAGSHLDLENEVKEAKKPGAVDLFAGMEKGSRPIAHTRVKRSVKSNDGVNSHDADTPGETMNVKGKDKGRKEKKKPKKKDKEKKYNPNNFSRPNPDFIKVKSNGAVNTHDHIPRPQKKDEALNPLFFGNQNLFSVKRDSFQSNQAKSQKKKDEGLNPLLYGNQNLFSANHNDYIKLSDIHSPFAKPPYGIPIDGEIKVYNDRHEVHSPVFTGDRDRLSKQEIALEKMNLLRILKEQQARLRAAARLPAPNPPRNQHPINKEEIPEPEHVLNKRSAIPEPEHVLNKRSATWQEERLHPMQYGQRGIFKPKHGRRNLAAPVNKDVQWMPYVDMLFARALTSNPRIARKRLREYAKFMGRDAEKIQKAVQLRNERRKLEEQNVRMISKKRRNKEYRKALLRNGIVPGRDINAEQKAEIPLKIIPRNENEDKAWMPYVNMNAAVAKVMKKNQENHRIKKREVNNWPVEQEVQQPYVMTSGIRRKRETREVLKTWIL